MGRVHVMETTSWRESVFIETTARAADPFSTASLVGWRAMCSSLEHPTPPARAWRQQLERSAPMAVVLNRERCRQSIERVRRYLETLEVLPTLANLVFADVHRRQMSAIEGGDDMIEPEIELLAGLLLAPRDATRTRRAPSRFDIARLIRSALEVHTYAGLSESARLIRDGDNLDSAMAATMRTLFLSVRGTAYIGHSDDMAVALFGGGDGHWFLSRFGFEIEDVIAVREGTRARWHAATGAMMREAQTAAANAGSGPDQVRAAFNRGVVAGLHHALCVRLDRLDEDLPDVDPSRARAVIERLSCGTTTCAKFDSVYDESPVVGRPWVRDGNLALLVVPGRLDTELIGLFEIELQRTMTGFPRRRANTVDEVTRRLLGSVLQGCASYTRLRYDIEENGQLARPDIDGVVQYEDMTIVIEGKCGPLSLPARRGDVRSLRGRLGDISKAWDQAQRDIRFLASAPQVELLDEAKMPVCLRGADPRRTYVVIPTLHPLISWSVQFRDLVAAGVLPLDARPWIVSITDLRIVCESLRRPAELFAYLTWREALLADGRVVVPDEIELFGAWLYGADMSAYPPDVTVVVMGMQADFDAYHHRLANAATGRRTPGKRVTAVVTEFLDELEKARPDGWLAASVSCLTASYRQLMLAEALAWKLARQLSPAHDMELGSVDDTDVFCLLDGAKWRPMWERIRATPSGRRRFAFAASAGRLRLIAASDANPDVPGVRRVPSPAAVSRP